MKKKIEIFVYLKGLGSKIKLKNKILFTVNVYLKKNMGNCFSSTQEKPLMKNIEEIDYLDRDTIAILIFEFEILKYFTITHTEIYLGGVIYGFGCCLDPYEPSGIFCYRWCNIKVDEKWKFGSEQTKCTLKKILKCENKYDIKKIIKFIENIKKEQKFWKKSDYNFLNNNCNNFTRTMLNYIDKKLNRYYKYDIILQIANNKKKTYEEK